MATGTKPTADLTDRGFTGHLHNNLGSGANDLGLIYMNARFYVPYIYRMVSPDTIVPDPTNPQSFNRYSYTLNSPVKYTDPSGHCANELHDAACWQEYDALFDQFLANNWTKDRIIDLIGTGENYVRKDRKIIGLYDAYRNCGSDLDCSTNAPRPWDPYAHTCGWQYWEDCYEPAITTQELVDTVFPDAIVFPAVALSGTGPQAIVGGAEVVGNFDTDEVSLFTYMGQGSGIGLEADASTYLGFAWNLDRNIDCEGIFHTLTVDVSYIEGFQVSFFWEDGSVPFTGETWGFSLGYIFLGGGASGAYTETDYYCRLGY